MKNGRKLSKRVENTVGKGEIAHYEQLLITSNFSFSHSVFKRLTSQGRQKVSLCGNGLIWWSPIFCCREGGNHTIVPFPKQQILDSSKLKEFTDDNFRCENGEFSREVESIVGKESLKFCCLV